MRLCLQQKQLWNRRIRNSLIGAWEVLQMFYWGIHWIKSLYKWGRGYTLCLLKLICAYFNDDFYEDFNFWDSYDKIDFLIFLISLKSFENSREVIYFELKRKFYWVNSFWELITVYFIGLFSLRCCKQISRSHRNVQIYRSFQCWWNINEKSI